MKHLHQAINALLFLLLFSCENSESVPKDYTFVRIDQLNTDLKQQIGIDINLQKQKADSVYKLDDQFYWKLVNEMEGGKNSNSFKRAHLDRLPTDLHGNPIVDIQIYDSLAATMMMCFANNMVMGDCDNSSTDSLCILKNTWHGYMSGKLDAEFSYSFFFSRLYEIYQKEGLSMEELHYTFLYLHYLGVLNATPRPSVDKNSSEKTIL